MIPLWPTQHSKYWHSFQISYRLPYSEESYLLFSSSSSPYFKKKSGHLRMVYVFMSFSRIFCGCPSCFFLLDGSSRLALTTCSVPSNLWMLKSIIYMHMEFFF